MNETCKETQFYLSKIKNKIKRNIILKHEYL